MKFIVTKSDIFKTLTHLQSIVSKKNTLPILSNILIEAENNSLSLSSTDMDISIKETINCNIVEKGSTTLNAQMMFEIIKKLPDTSEIEFISNDGKLLTIRSNVSKFSLSCLPKDEFPIINVETSKGIRRRKPNNSEGKVHKDNNKKEMPKRTVTTTYRHKNTY